MPDTHIFHFYVSLSNVEDKCKKKKKKKKINSMIMINFME